MTNPVVKKLDEVVDVGIHDGLPNQGQGAVLNGESFGEPVRFNARHTWNGRCSPLQNRFARISWDL